MNHPSSGTLPLASVRSSNLGLAPFDLTGYKGVHGLNFYDEDRLLQKIIERYSETYTPEHLNAIKEHLHQYGELAGGVLNDLTEACHKDGKWGKIKKYDRFGERVESIEYSQEQIELRRINYEHGIVNLDRHPDWNYEFTFLHKMALAYLTATNGEGGVACPLAMLDGMVQILEALGTPKQKEKFLPLIVGPESKSHFMVGQYLTERVGGSNVGENRTIARQIDEEKWVLEGEKWFCSNPGDLWVTTARIEGSSIIGLFLVSRIKENGELNGFYMLRKKQIIGSKGKVTVEGIYEDLEAELLGRPGHGLGNVIKYVVQTSRIHVSTSSIAYSRRAFMEARAYTKVRTAYKKTIAQFPSVQRILAEMQILHSSVLWCIFKNMMLTEKKEKITQILIPLLKYSASTHSAWIINESIMLHGGNGVLDDFSCLPRLRNDAIINEIWEGSHQIITGHALKAFFRPQIQKSYFDLLSENAQGAEKYPNLLSSLAVFQEEKQNLESLISTGKKEVYNSRLFFCDKLFYCFALSEWLNDAKLYQEPISIDFAQGLSEMIKYGKGSPLSKESIFRDSDRIKALIDY